jgi:hypothetical protein
VSSAGILLASYMQQLVMRQEHPFLLMRAEYNLFLSFIIWPFNVAVKKQEVFANQTLC